MIRHIRIVCLCLALCALPASPALLAAAAPAPLAAPTVDIPYNQGNIIDNTFNDAIAAYSSPLHWNGSDWLTASAVVAGTAGLYFLADQGVKDFAQSHRNGATNAVANVVQPLGNGLYVIPALAATYLYGQYSDDRHLSEAATLSLESIVVSGVRVVALKVSSGRYRPSTGAAYDTWHGPFTMSDSENSFPSGHASTVFSIATTFALEYPGGWVPYVSYGLASLVALSRINDNAHWASDVFLGSALGYFTAKALYGYQRQRDLNSCTLAPAINPQQTGLTLSYSF